MELNFRWYFDDSSKMLTFSFVIDALFGLPYMYTPSSNLHFLLISLLKNIISESLSFNNWEDRHLKKKEQKDTRHKKNKDGATSASDIVHKFHD